MGYDCSSCDKCDGCTCHDTDTWSVHTDGDDLDDTEQWCEYCYDEHSFYCALSEENWSNDVFTEGVDEDGETICVEYARANDRVSVVNKDGDVVWVTPEEATNEAYKPNLNTEAAVAKETNFADFYWRLPTAKEKVNEADVDKRVLVLIPNDGAEITSVSNSGVKKYRDEIFLMAAEAGADVGDSDTLNVYTRMRLIEVGILPDAYRL